MVVLLGGVALVFAAFRVLDAKRHPVRLPPDTPVTFIVTDDAPVQLSPAAARAIVRILNETPEVDVNRRRSAHIGRFEAGGHWIRLREHGLVTTDHSRRMVWKHSMITDAYLAFSQAGYELSPALAHAVVERIERYVSANPATSQSPAPTPGR